MRNRSESHARSPWPFLCAALLMCYALAPLTYEGELDLYALSRLADLISLVISFPLGLLAVLGLEELADHSVHRSQCWALCMVFAYFQWFHLVPLLCRRRPVRAVILNLAGDERVAPAAVAEAPPADARPARLVAAHAQLMPQFNDLGRTPLERVFDKSS